MKTRSLRSMRLLVQFVIPALLAVPALRADTTFTFQNGAAGYAGAQDVSINTQYSQYNGGNGVLWRGDSELGCYTTTGTGSYTVRYLLKFGGLSIPAGSKVVSATLAIALDSWNEGSGNITGFYLKNTWSGASSQIGWIHRDDGNDWGAGGASSAGVDTVAAKGFQVPPLRPVGAQVVTVPLDLAQVQSWIDSPATNQGIILVNNNAGEIVRPVSVAGSQSMRPKLTVVIAAASGVQITLSPASATLPAGAQQTFIATVSGSPNTAVSWTATGGSITPAGVYTAGSNSGSYAVIATSVADATRSATAAVSVRAVKVSVSPGSATLLPGQTQQFTASVTGSSNTSVTWTATGGTITSSGLFTAGSTTGNSFSVKATSVADTSKSATAAVSIQAVQVTVSPTSATLLPGQTQQFTASVTGSSNTSVTWTATGGTISASGLYTAGQSTGNFAVTATAAADLTKSATAAAHIDTALGLPPIPRQSDGAYVVLQSPVTGMHFTAPALIRIYADPFDIDAADQDGLTVNFLMNGQSIGTFTGSAEQNGYFALNASNVAAGTYAITAQITTQNHGVVTSAPVTVFVDNPAISSGPVYNLTADVVLAGSQSAAYAGTAANHCLINGNGFQIRSAAGYTGSLVISYCDIRNLGTAANPAIGVVVNGAGSVQLTGNVWESFGSVTIGTNDQSQAVIRNNEFRENTLVAVGSQPSDVGTLTVPVFQATGNSSTQKYFQGNNVGLSTVVFENTRNWLIGGSTDAESNVLMGVRCGFTINGSTNMVLRGNYSQHNYPHRFSQGENFELVGDGFLAEHNVIRSSSWPLRGMGGEFRYNLVDASGNSDSVVQSPLSNINMHHNIFSFTVSQTLYSPGAGINIFDQVDNIQFHHNVMDGGGTLMGFYGNPVSVSSGSYIGSLRNNVFYNFAGLSNGPVLAGAFDESTNPPLARLRYADYNDFFNPDAPNQTNYGLGVVGVPPGAAGYGMHDLGGLNGHVNPKFTQPTALPFPFLPQDIWTRAKKVSDVLSMYRLMYSPATGSPLLGAGDPQDGAGGNIGVVGNGEPADQFGRFGSGGGTPAAPAIGSFTASPASVQAGQSATLNWSVIGADMLSLAPGLGTVTGTSIAVTPSVTTTYTLTATNAGGSSTATAVVTVTSGTTVGVTISPVSASLGAGATRQFTATVSGTSNTAVTWTATGGTVSASGLYTAGATTGTFAVTARSVQDSTKSASAAITITPPQPVGISVAPASATVFAGGTQQLTATVTNASNTSVTWSATGGSVSPAGLYTAGTAAGSFTATATSVQDPTKSASAAITIVTPTTSSHPRIILDPPTLATLRSRAQSRTAEWVALKALCDSFTGGGTVNFIGDNGYPNPPNVGEGYQGSGYIDALLPLGLCYQSTRLADPTTASKYGAKAVAVLMAMSDPAHQSIDGTPVWDRDDGYGIRNFGVAMGIGYDWFHDLMSPAQLSQLQTALNHWITGFETDPSDNFEYEHPQGNYFAGYYAAKCMAALAVQGDSPLGDTWWNDWYNNQHLQRVQPYYAANLGGGGWTEGFAQYGILSSRNQSLPALAVKTAKGIDLIHAPQPYPFPLDQARYLMQFTWPTRDIIDDRGELYSTGDPSFWPGTGSVDMYRFYAGFLAMWGDPAAPMMHKYARDAKAALDAIQAGGTTEWIDFLFWDPTAAEASDYSSLPLSYLAPGIGGVAARSDWSNTATFLSFLSSPYINNPSAGHEAFDKGSPAMERNRNPLLVNPPAWMSHEPNGDAGWNLTYDDRFGNWDADHTTGNRVLYNTFQVRRLDAQGGVTDHYGQWALTRDDGIRTRIGRYEDGGSYVLAVGQYLEDMYRPFQTICAGRSPVTGWSRQIVYLRPSQFVVYDRTGVCDPSLDQYLAFHFPANPIEVAGTAGGARRFDVNPGLFAGSMTTILPANATVVTADHLSSDPTLWNKMWRSEVRAPGAAAANHLWMNVFDLAATPGQVAAASPVNVTTGAVVGTLLQSSTGNHVVICGTASFGVATAGPIGYVVPAVQARHVITDLNPQAGYTVAVTVSGGNHVVTATAGGSLQASANGVLTFGVSATGVLQP